MNRIRAKSPRLRLAPELYEKLRHEVLRRDGWRCQSCGALSNLRFTIGNCAASPGMMQSKTSLRFALDATHSSIGDPRAAGDASRSGCAFRACLLKTARAILTVLFVRTVEPIRGSSVPICITDPAGGIN